MNRSLTAVPEPSPVPVPAAKPSARRAKIVCTLGPASSDAETIGLLIDAGMNVARLNFSHGDAAFHEKLVAAVRGAASARGRAVAILQDLQGPKIRVGRFVGGAAHLVPGAPFTLTTQEVMGGDRAASVSYAELPRDVRPGDSILLDDGLLRLEVEKVGEEDVQTRVVIGGILRDHKGMNLPGVRISTPALTEKDRQDIEIGRRLGVDFVALSFVRSPDDVLEARRLAGGEGPRGTRTPIIAKIEKPEAVERLDAILDAADAVMVARGDLGVEVGPEKVPLVQKRIVAAANARGKAVIVATQMLESMTSSPTPTRAEASDVANAVLDGADALMLSGETAAGKYPILAVRTMARIIEEIERDRPPVDTVPRVQVPVCANAIAGAAVAAGRQMNLHLLAVYSDSGGIARLLSGHRPDAVIYALTTRESTYRRLALHWGVVPLHVEVASSTDAAVALIERLLRERGLVHSGDLVAMAMGAPVGSGEQANMLKLHKIP